MQAQLVGGFAFDEQAEVSQDWAELGAGLFALPEILVRKTDDQCGVVYTVAASSEEQRQQKVAALQEKSRKLVECQPGQESCSRNACFSGTRGTRGAPMAASGRRDSGSHSLD